MTEQQVDGMVRRELLRRGAALGIGATALGGLLAACGGGSSTMASAGGGGGGGEVSGTVSAWAWQPDETGYPAVWQSAGKRFEKGGPGRTYDYTYIEFSNYFTKFKTANAGGQPPDILEMAWAGEYREVIEANALLALDDLLPELPEFFPAVMESLVVDGKTYAIPQDVNTLSIAYNVEMFEKLGIEPPKTLDDLLALAEPIRSSGKQPMSLAIKEQWPAGDTWFAQLAYTDPKEGQALIEANAGKLPWDAPPFAAAAKMCQQIGESGIVADGASSLDTNAAVSLFGKGEAAMLYPAGNFLTGLIDSANENKFTYDLFPFPPLKTGVEPRATGGPAVLWSIPTHAKNVDAAREMMKLFTDKKSNEQLVKGGFFPASPFNLSANKDPIYQTMASFQDTAASRVIFQPEVYAALLNSASSVLAGEGSADSITSAMTEVA